MGAQENKQATQDAYKAFAAGDAEGAMKNIDDSVGWTVRGDNALSGTYHGKQEVG
jgi:ketosteroid isomerase-like protein